MGADQPTIALNVCLRKFGRAHVLILTPPNTQLCIEFAANALMLIKLKGHH